MKNRFKKWRSCVETYQDEYDKMLASSPVSADWRPSHHMGMFSMLFDVFCAMHGAEFDGYRQRRKGVEVLDIYEGLLRKRGLSPDGQTRSESADYSIGNSWLTVEASWLAAIVADDEVCVRIAKEIWDPEDARYVGKNSEVCTWQQQALAYWMQGWWSERSRGVSVTAPSGGLSIDLMTVASMFLAVDQKDSVGLREHLTNGLKLHAASVGEFEAVLNPLDLVYLPGSAAANMAKREGWFTDEALEASEWLLVI